MVRVFANGPGDLGSIPGRVIPKIFKKWYLMPPCLTLSIIRYGSRVKWSNPGKGVAPSPIPCVVAIEKGAFWSPTLLFTYFQIRAFYKQKINLYTKTTPENTVHVEVNQFVNLDSTNLLFRRQTFFFLIIILIIQFFLLTYSSREVNVVKAIILKTTNPIVFVPPPLYCSGLDGIVRDLKEK